MTAPSPGETQPAGPLSGGRIRLARPLAPGVDSVAPNDPTFSDLAGVLTGVKPVTYTDCFPAGFRRLAALCRRLKLEYLLAEDYLSKAGHHFSSGKKMVLIGRRRRDLVSAARSWAVSPSAWGTWLGYPGCCVKEYSAWSDGKKEDLVRATARATGGRGRLDFRLNNVWNYFSRMNFGDAADRAAYESFLRHNDGLDLASAHVVSWHPCSYRCRASAAKAGVIFGFMEHHAPDYAAQLRGLLGRQVLFWDKFRYAVLGPARPRVRALLDGRLDSLAASCDLASPSAGGVRLSRGGKQVLLVPKREALLLDFRP